MERGKGSRFDGLGFIGHSFGNSLQVACIWNPADTGWFGCAPCRSERPGVGDESEAWLGNGM